ncbi:MAG: hypothetical protein Q3966_06445 [Neisseria sp.]|nr:hypothetical protein [Neisseria sp.]
MDINNPPGPCIRIRLNRQSVCMGDDIMPHDKILNIPASRTPAQILEELMQEGYFPLMPDAHWKLIATTAGHIWDLALIDQYGRTNWFAAPHTPIAALAKHGGLQLDFQYLTQDRQHLIAARQPNPQTRNKQP